MADKKPPKGHPSKTTGQKPATAPQQRPDFTEYLKPTEKKSGKTQGFTTRKDRR